MNPKQLADDLVERFAGLTFSGRFGKAWLKSQIEEVLEKREKHLQGLISGEVRAEVLMAYEDCEKICWEVMEKRIGVSGQAEAYKIGHDAGARICAEKIHERKVEVSR